MNNNKKMNIALGLLTLISICVITILILFAINKLGGIDLCVGKIRDISKNHFSLGLLFFILLQIAQILISVIPGEPVEVMAGMLYGTFGGSLICMFGIILTTIFIFYITRKYGIKLVKKILGEDNLKEYKLFEQKTKLEYIIFIIFLIPGTPKDALIYLAALTPINIRTFLIITSFARIPSIISSTFAGANIGNGNYLVSIIVFVLTAIIGLLGIYLHPKIVSKLEKMK
ncbi:MAG: VTT domain-containing protein [Oscillospiraceae bacterium]